MKTMKTTRKIRSVAVAVKLSDASWRDFLMGFFDYAKRGTHWDIRVVQSADELQRAVSGCLGVVTGIEPDKKTQALLAKAGVRKADLARDLTHRPRSCIHLRKRRKKT